MLNCSFQLLWNEKKTGDSLQRYYFMPTFALNLYHCYCAVHPKQSDQNEVDVIKVAFFFAWSRLNSCNQITRQYAIVNANFLRNYWLSHYPVDLFQGIYRFSYCKSNILIFHFCGSSRFKILNWLSTFLTEKSKLDYC